jgi:cytoskeletal protein CcmA (bactofilin family)
MTSSESARTVVAGDVEIVGSVKAAGGMQFDGKLSGDLTCGGSVSIGPTAAVKGNMTVESVTLSGQLDGNIAARDRIELKSTAKVTGDIKSKRLTVEDGVTFTGKVEVNPGTQAAPAEPVERPRPPAEDENRRSVGLFGKR